MSCVNFRDARKLSEECWRFGICARNVYEVILTRGTQCIRRQNSFILFFGRQKVPKPKLIIIYGPPAAGKLTVAQALAKKTGYVILHNHATIDLVRSVLPSKSKNQSTVLMKIRKDLLVACVADRVPGVIYTWVYGYEDDDAEFSELIQLYKKGGGTVHLVHLVPTVDTLLMRVSGKSRRQYRKMKTKQKIRNVIKAYDMYTSYPKYPSLRIDNSKLSVTKTVTLIMDEYRL